MEIDTPLPSPPPQAHRSLASLLEETIDVRTKMEQLLDAIAQCAQHKIETAQTLCELPVASSVVRQVLYGNIIQNLLVADGSTAELFQKLMHKISVIDSQGITFRQFDNLVNIAHQHALVTKARPNWRMQVDRTVFRRKVTEGHVTEYTLSLCYLCAEKKQDTLIFKDVYLLP